MADMSVMAPTLPMYIIKIMIIFPHTDSFGVRPMVSPTVAYALTVSKNRGRKDESSVMVSRKVPAVTTNSASDNSPNAFNIDSLDTLRLNIWGLLPLNIFVADRQIVKKVVVFMPPPVLPGLAPMNMRMMVKKAAEVDAAAKSEAKNPAVRELAEWKKETNIESPPVSLNRIVPATSSIGVIIRTIFVCKVKKCLLLYISAS